jgi:hypothetical protein
LRWILLIGLRPIDDGCGGNPNYEPKKDNWHVDEGDEVHRGGDDRYTKCA